MRPVKTKPRFGCDFCKHTATAPTMAKHEKRCYRNPDRVCDWMGCDGNGTIDTGCDGYTDGPKFAECPHCAIAKEMAAYLADNTRGGE